ncbi:zinc finger translocation-associated protein-like [Engraulis encrasicolus]|uniref:zinc finger translocation-associated protein-like n=1 Tax=Engraulis encrasicolus TaxID=184585 RepID=UPI002FD0C2A7
MEKQEPREPEIQPCAEQADCLSLIISGEEETIDEPTDFGVAFGGDDGITNGHGQEDDEEEGEGEEEEDTGVPSGSPTHTTSYWSISEDPDAPFLLSPIPGPSPRKTTTILNNILTNTTTSPPPSPSPSQVGSSPTTPPARASRPGLSRIPGRDHRRYYHEYWRSEYLMDFDPRRHGMICMVCGSSLATLKLSTIKRHIRQKHPDSLLWSPADKELIRQGWESHLGMEALGQRPFGLGSGAGDGDGDGDGGESGGGGGVAGDGVGGFVDHEEDNGGGGGGGGGGIMEDGMREVTSPRQLDGGRRSTGKITVVTPKRSPSSANNSYGGGGIGGGSGGMMMVSHHLPSSPLPLPPNPMQDEMQMPSAETLERYLNDSLHAWFRQEFLMEYQAEASRLVCMVCGGTLPSLHLDHIKSHVLDLHPNSLVFSSEEKHCILQGWAQTHESESSPLPDFYKLEPPDTKDSMDTQPHPHPNPTDPGSCMAFLSQDVDELITPIPIPMEMTLDLHLNHTHMTLNSSPPPNTLPPHHHHHPLPSPPPPTTSAPLLGTSALPSPSKRPAPPPPLHHHHSTSPPAPPAPPPPPRPPPRPQRKRKLRDGAPWRLRLDYMVAYGPQGAGCYCMVCWQELGAAKVSGFRQHIQESHPETTRMSRREREQVADAWVRDAPHRGGGDGTHGIESDGDIIALSISEDMELEALSPTPTPPHHHNKGATQQQQQQKHQQTKSKGQADSSSRLKGSAAKNGPATTSPSATASDLAAPPPSPAPSTGGGGTGTGRHGHYPGKDQRRNYQARWRTEFLMDYDGRRHGLICMVCGATLATLKVSTIKRHIQQVHPASLAYSARERQQALQAYGHHATVDTVADLMAMGTAASADDGFATQDYGHGQDTTGMGMGDANCADNGSDGSGLFVS